MDAAAAAAETVRNISSMLPIPVYFAVHEHAAQAHITHIEERAAHRNDRIGIDVCFNGVVHETPCAAGKEMRAAIYETFPNVKKSSKDTLDAWHKMKVVVDGHVMRLEELIPPSARRGETVATGKTVESASRDHGLSKILKGPPGNILGQSAGVSVLPRERPEHVSRAKTPKAAKVGKAVKRRKAATASDSLKDKRLRQLLTAHMTTLMLLLGGGGAITKEDVLARIANNPASILSLIGHDDMLAA